METKTKLIILIFILAVVGVITGSILLGQILKEKHINICEEKGFVYMGSGLDTAYCGEKDSRGIIVNKYRTTYQGDLEKIN